MIMGGIDGKVSGGQLSDFLAIASVLADPARVAEEYQKLEKAKQEAQEIIKLVGPANEIMAMRSDAEKLHNAAQTALDDAETFSKKMKGDAQIQAADIVSKAQEKAAEIVTAAEEKMQDVIAAEAKAIEASKDAKEFKSAYEEKFALMSAEYESLSKAAGKAAEESLEASKKAQGMTAKLQDVASQLAEALGEIAKD
jgi:hypothetical protein